MLLTILRGLPGSGKSTFARSLGADVVCSADDFFGPEYAFNPNLLSAAHTECRRKAEDAMSRGLPHIVIDNTNTRKWEYAPYVNFAEKYGYSVEIIILRGDYGNIHNVPREVIDKMKTRWEE